MPSNSDLDRLGDLALEAGRRDDWHEFADFATARSHGLRSQALKALEVFLGQSVSWPFEARLGFARWLLEHSLHFGDRSVALPQPLCVELLVPTIREWSEGAPDSAEAHEWLARLGCDEAMGHLRRAFELDPSSDRVRWLLVEWLIGDVEYNQHHLPDFYIHDPRDDLPILDQADLLISGGTRDAGEALRLHGEVSELRRQAEAWLALHSREGDFASS